MRRTHALGPTGESTLTRPFNVRLLVVDTPSLVTPRDPTTGSYEDPSQFLSQADVYCLGGSHLPNEDFKPIQGSNKFCKSRIKHPHASSEARFIQSTIRGSMMCKVYCATPDRLYEILRFPYLFSSVLWHITIPILHSPFSMTILPRPGQTKHWKVQRGLMSLPTYGGCKPDLHLRSNRRCLFKRDRSSLHFPFHMTENSVLGLEKAAAAQMELGRPWKYAQPRHSTTTTAPRRD